MFDHEGFSVHPSVEPKQSVRRAAWQALKATGVKVREVYTDRETAQRDADAATKATGIRFVVTEYIAVYKPFTSTTGW